MKAINYKKLLVRYGPIVILIMLGFFFGRSCGSGNKKLLEQKVEASEIRVEELMSDIKERDVVIDSIQQDNRRLSDKKVQLDKELAKEKIRQRDLVKTYERKLDEIADFSPQQADSFLLARYPNVPSDSLNKHIAEDLVEGDMNSELLSNAYSQIENLESRAVTADSIINNQNQIISSLESNVADLNAVIREKDIQIESYKKHIRKLRWKNFLTTTGGFVGGVVAGGAIAYGLLR